MTFAIDWNDLHGRIPTTRHEADDIADVFDICINGLVTLIEQENHLLSSGEIEQALALLDEKQSKSVEYARATDLTRRNLIALTRLIPNRMPELKDKQNRLMRALDTNARLISTIRTLSENLLRGAAQETSAKHRLSTYGENGRTTQPDPRTPSNAIIVSTTM